MVYIYLQIYTSTSVIIILVSKYTSMRKKFVLIKKTRNRNYMGQKVGGGVYQTGHELGGGRGEGIPELV